MSYSYNHCTLMGRLVKDPEFKQINDSFCKLTFVLAVNRGYKKEADAIEADFIPICLTGNNAIIGEKILQKGAAVLIWGNIHVRNYEKNNERKWITEVIGKNFQVVDRKGSINEGVEEEEVEKIIN
jgi:single-strand DNA-binding protein